MGQLSNWDRSVATAGARMTSRIRSATAANSRPRENLPCAWHAWLSNSYFNIRCNSASSTLRHPVSVLRYRTMWSCWTRPLRLQCQGQRQMVDQQQQGLRRRRHRREASSKRQIFLGCLGKCKRCLGNVFICLVFNLIGTFNDIQCTNEGEQIWHFLNLGKKKLCSACKLKSWSKCHVQSEVHCYESSALSINGESEISTIPWAFLSARTVVIEAFLSLQLPLGGGPAPSSALWTTKLLPKDQNLNQRWKIWRSVAWCHQNYQNFQVWQIPPQFHSSNLTTWPHWKEHR